MHCVMLASEQPHYAVMRSRNKAGTAAVTLLRLICPDVPATVLLRRSQTSASLCGMICRNVKC